MGIRIYKAMTVFAVLGVIAPVQAADSTTDASVTSFPMPSFSQMQAQQLANFTSCGGNTIGSAISNIGDVLTNPGGASQKQGTVVQQTVQSGVCPGSEELPEFENSCTAVKSKDGGGFNEDIFKARAFAVQSVQSTLRCKKANLQRLQGELGCLNQIAQTLTSQVNSMQTTFQKNLTNYQTSVQSINQVIDDRTNQMKRIEEIVGDGDKGGLAAVKKQMQEAVTQMSAANKGLKDRVTQTDRMKKNFDQMVENRKMALTGECFKSEGQVGYKCASGETCTAMQYTVERYQQNSLIRNGKVQRDNKLLQQKATANAGKLQALLNKIFSQASNDTTLVQNPQDTSSQSTALANANKVLKIFNVQQIESQYGASLRAFDGNGLKIHDFVMSALTSCYNSAVDTVVQERDRSGSALNNYILSMDDNKKQLSQDMDTQLTAYANMQREAIKAITGSAPENFAPQDACKDAEVQNKSKCLDDAQKITENLFHGGAGAEFTINLSAKQQQMLITVKCSGVTGCLSKLENLHRNVIDDIKKQESNRTQFVQQANSSVDQTVSQLAQMMSGQGQYLQSQLDAINKQLSANGIDPIKLNKVQTEEMEKDANPPDGTGLYKMPKNLMAVIGGKAGMLDVQSDSFQSGLQGIGQENKEVAKKEAAAVKMLARIEQLKQECKDAAGDAIKKGVSTSLSTYESLNCNSMSDWCDPTKNSYYQELSNLGATGIDVEGMETVTAALSSGQKCDSTSEDNAGTISTLKSRLSSWEDKLKTATDDKAKTEIQSQIEKAQDALATATRAQDKLGQNKTSLWGKCTSAARKLKNSLNSVGKKLDGLNGTSDSGDTD